MDLRLDGGGCCHWADGCGDSNDVGDNSFACACLGIGWAVCDASSAACDGVDGGSVHSKGGKFSGGRADLPSLWVIVLSGEVFGGGQSREEGHGQCCVLHCDM